jgi:hypothetical protein
LSGLLVCGWSDEVVVWEMDGMSVESSCRSEGSGSMATAKMWVAGAVLLDEVRLKEGWRGLGLRQEFGMGGDNTG